RPRWHDACRAAAGRARLLPEPGEASLLPAPIVDLKRQTSLLVTRTSCSLSRPAAAQRTSRPGWENNCYLPQTSLRQSVTTGFFFARICRCAGCCASGPGTTDEVANGAGAGLPSPTTTNGAQ